MKLKEIWQFIKTVIWPSAKPFICASREEAEELVTMWRLNEVKSEVNDVKSVSMPSFIIRCIDALEPDEK